MNFIPVFEMYVILDVFLPGGIFDKDEMDSRTMLKGNWDRLIITAE